MGAAAVRPAGPGSRSRRGRSVPGEFQHSRLLAAALQEVSQRGFAHTSASHIIARARVSRATFYELFDDRDDCLAALFEQAVTQLAAAAAPAYASKGTWPARLRNALAALLAFLESERELGAFALACIAGDGQIHPRLRARVLERLRGAVEDGRRQARAGGETSPLAGELVVAGVVAVIHARLQRARPLSDLCNPLMSMIVLPYLGLAAAARELHRAPSHPPVLRPVRARGALDGFEMRVTYRTALVLSAIAELPGASNVAIAQRAGVSDQGQISKMLVRLAGLGLLENTGTYSAGAANAWHLTPTGGALVSELARRFATTEPARRRRHDGCTTQAL
jgi:AcrR family transcriptional regulator